MITFPFNCNYFINKSYFIIERKSRKNCHNWSLLFPNIRNKWIKQNTKLLKFWSKTVEINRISTLSDAERTPPTKKCVWDGITQEFLQWRSFREIGDALAGYFKKLTSRNEWIPRNSTWTEWKSKVKYCITVLRYQCSFMKIWSIYINIL